MGGGGLRAEAALRHPWLRNPLGLSLPSRQIGAGIINPVQTPIWPLTILRPCRTAGKAPRSGGSDTGWALHAVRGVDRPCAVILTAYRLLVPLRSARHTAPTTKANSQNQQPKPAAKTNSQNHSQNHSTSWGRLALSVQRSPTLTAWRLSERVGWIGRGRSARCRQWWIAHLSLDGGGLRAEAAALNNPAALPGAGRAPRSGARITGRALHAVRGVDRPCAVILTAYRLHVPRRSARHTAPTASAKATASATAQAEVGWR